MLKMQTCKAVLIIGESGTGKSTSIESLNPAETFIIAVTAKPLPFRGAFKMYTRWCKENPTGNYYVTDDWQKIITVFNSVNSNMPHIKTVVIDDFQYVMCNEYMKRTGEKGWEKFNDMAHHSWSVFNELNKAREDLDCFIMSHSEVIGDTAKVKCIGKMLETKIGVEGLFTTILHSVRNDSGYGFITQYHKNYMAKSPRGMLESFIENDLQLVKTKMNEYFNEDIAA